MFSIFYSSHAMIAFIIVLSGLGIFFTGHLSWQECLRLFVIQVGLAFCYFRYRKVLHAVRSADEAIVMQARMVLALCLIFILTQFDPATSAVAFGNHQKQMNPFFIFTSVCVLWVGGAYGMDHWRAFKWRQLTFLDRCFLLSVLGILVIVYLSNMLIGAVSWKDVLFVVKAIGYVLIWFLITKNFDVSETPKEGNRWFDWVERGRWKVVFLTVNILFGIALVHGAFRVGQVLTYYSESQDAISQHQWDLAEAQFKRIEQMNATTGLRYISNQIRSDLAVIHLNKGLVQNAQDIIRSLREDITYDIGERHKRIGYIYFRARQWRKAIDAFSGVLNISKKDPEILDLMGRAYRNLNDVQGFLSLVQEYRYMPQFEVVEFEDAVFLGKINFFLRSYAEARKYYELAVSKKPSDDYAHYQLGRVYLAENQIQKSVDQFLKVISQKPDFADAHYWLGVCYEKMSQQDQAMSAYQRTVEILPNHRAGLQALIRILN